MPPRQPPSSPSLQRRSLITDQARFLAGRRNSPEVAALTRWIALSLAALQDDLVTATPERVAHLQGRAMQLRDMMDQLGKQEIYLDG